MYLLKKISQHRRDFRAIYKCRSCGHELEASGYDDAYFHQNVIPAKACPSCGAVGDTEPATTPDVPAGVVI